MTDKEYTDLLLEVVYSKRFGMKLKSLLKKDKELREWIYKKINEHYTQDDLRLLRFDDIENMKPYEQVYLALNQRDKLSKKCIVCGKEFLDYSIVGFGEYHKNCKPVITCSKKCANKSRGLSLQSTMIKKYGKSNSMFIPEFVDKMKTTNMERYGVEWSFSSDIIREKTKKTNIEKYGCDNPLGNKAIRKKRTDTMIERYGVDVPLQNKDIVEKMKNTNLEKYGTEWVLGCKEIHEKGKTTSIEKYGVPYPSQSEEIKEKIRNTNFERYGVEYSFQAEDVKDKIRNTNIERYGVDNPMKSKKIQEKAMLTCIEKYGTLCTLNDKNIMMKAKETSLSRYGCDNPMQSNIIKEKIRNSNLEKYGYASRLSIPAIQEKVKKTNLERYGVEYPLASTKVREKIRNTNIERYGVENPSQNHDIRMKAQCKCVYNDISFDSLPEIALYIYLVDNNIDFEYQPHVSFDYEYDGIQHKYFPDFRIGDKYVEIKGDHFFCEDKMICPWDKSKNGLYQSKYKCMIKNEITILRSHEYKKYIQYVNEKYGYDYLKQFKKH